MPDILFPAGRMVGGNLDKLFPRKNKDGTPKTGKDGQPTMQCSVGYAIPKTQQRWQDEYYDHPVHGRIAWGKTIYETGAAAHPNLVLVPSFSWKITDGDSVIPNQNGKRPCDQNGYPGHWVLWFSQSWLPKRVNADGTVELPEGAIVPGYYIQMFGSVAGNQIKQGDTPGVYLNPIAVALVGEGERIASDVDTTAVGFGGAPLPAGAKPVTAAAPQFAAPAAHLAAVNPTPTPSAPAAAAPAPVVPNPAILNVPAPVARTMTPKCAGVTYEQFMATGQWTDELLRQHGYML